uniref:RING-type domain-containing protein n=1 Tax=Panagrellus redivivus TaxID=6233 RepID=A0A7E4W1V0_PANRE
MASTTSSTDTASGTADQQSDVDSSLENVVTESNASTSKPSNVKVNEYGHQCAICDVPKGPGDVTQLLPCMHIFCTDCIAVFKQFGGKVCPQLHCYSSLHPNEEHRLNQCENDLCAHRFGPPNDLFKLTVCKHEICGNCFEEAIHRDPPLCPIADCAVVLEEDEKDTCDMCKTLTDGDKLLSTLCCNSIVCQNCFIQAWERTDKPRTTTEVRCPKDECFDKKKGAGGSSKNKEGKAKGTGKKQVTTPALAKCKGAPDCARVALRNFPSEQECEHDVCLQCLDRMIADCQVSDSMPMCPNDRCHLPYRFESVAALKALLPDRAKYFAGLALELNQGYEAIKDDTATPMHTPTQGFKSKEKLLIVKCNVSEDEEGPTLVSYIKEGSLGGFIRELRRAMRIMATDKVYGYFVRRDEGGDEQLVVNQTTHMKPISTYKLDSETLIIIDVTGIVMAKTNQKAS